MRTFISIIFLISAIIFPAGPAGDVHAESGPLEKGGRGAANMTTGWTEALTPSWENWDRKHTIYSFIEGIPQGAANATLRTLVGMYEFVTFCVPRPEGFKPIIKPNVPPYEVRHKFDDIRH